MSKELTRRDFIIAAGGIAAGFTLSKIADKVGLPQTIPTIPEIQPIQNQESAQQLLLVEGTFPSDRFNFSPTITKYNLIPRVLPENQWASDRMQAGLDYLKKVYTALKATSESLSETSALKAPMLDEIGVVSNDNFPTSLSRSTTAQEIVRDYLKDIEEGKILIWGASVQNVPYLIGTYNHVNFTGRKGYGMHIGGQVVANADFPFGPARMEDAGTIYTRYTDLQVALKMVHEYAHYKQSQRLLELVLTDLGKDKEEYTDTQYVSTLIDQKVANLIVEMNKDTRIDRSKVNGTVSFNEAQANQVAQFILWTVVQLNNGNRVPGTEDDSFPVNPSSLYQTFNRAIFYEKNRFDPAWLSLHSNWNKK